MGVINMGQYSGSKVKGSVLGHLLNGCFAVNQYVFYILLIHFGNIQNDYHARIFFLI